MLKLKFNKNPYFNVMPELNKPLQKRKISISALPNHELIYKKLGEAMIINIEKEIMLREPNISHDELRIKRYQVLKQMAGELKKMKD